ncbi:MAG: sulfite exporter TauE/SafE family protein [Firmicutes bacterium]|nr:sulfite exporter TauE/SafE family protein [Bacillota bacterium]
MAKVQVAVIPVEGMFCNACENRIQGALMGLPGVKSAEADFTKGQVRAIWDPDKVSVETVKKTIEDEGYKVAQKGSGMQVSSILIILLALYMIADHLGWTNAFNVFPQVESDVTLGAVFVIGLLTSVHCIAMCGGINLSQSTLAASVGKKVLVSNLKYGAGRVISYTVIGGLVGGIGSVISFGGALKGIVAIIAGAAMLIMALGMLGVFKSFRALPLHLPKGLYGTVSAKVGGGSFVIGLLNGLMPCGPLQAMQIYALSTGSPVTGALSMMLFALGTLPLTFGFGAFAGKLNKSFSRYMLTVSSIIIFMMGMHMVNTGLALSGSGLPAKQSDAALMAEVSGDVQKIETEIDYGKYPAFAVRSGIPVEWNIVVPAGKLNGCNGEIIVPEYDLDVKLSEGDNLVKFTPKDTGTVRYSCWMGMIKSSIEVVE